MVTIVNKKARFEYEIVEKFEAGIALEGSEVKSVRAGHVNLGDAFCFVENGELYLKNCRISAYDKATVLPPDELRSRKCSLLCSAFGLGLTWGTMWLRTNEINVCNINYHKIQ